MSSEPEETGDATPVSSADSGVDSVEHRVRAGRIWLLAFAFICAVGIVVAVELTRIYILTNTNPEFVSFCAINEGINCETVAASPYALSFGVLNSVWAIFAYLWTGGVAVWGAIARSREPWPRGVLLGVSAAMLLASLALAYVMKFVIGALCVLCLALDVVNLALFVLAVVLWRTFSRDRSPAQLVTDDARWLMRRPAAMVGTLVVTAALLLGAVEYSTRTEARAAAAAEGWASPGRSGATVGIGPDQTMPASQHDAPTSCEEPDCPCQREERGREQPLVHMGRDERGHQWIGAAEPKVIIEEFTDYECPFCRKAHLQLRAALARNPHGLRVVHRHYPLDRACNSSIKGDFHQRACELSRTAHCAGEQGRFWEMNDYLFQHAATIKQQRLSAIQLAERLELDLERFECCLRASETEEHLREDIGAGHGLGLKGTPAYLIDGKVHYGALKHELLDELLGQ